MGLAPGVARHASRTWPVRSVLGELPDELRTRLLRLGSLRSYCRDEVIIAESATTTEVYAILHGFVRVMSHTSTGNVAVLAIRTIGDLVGELAAMDGRPRASTVVAASRTTAMVVDALRFRAFMAEHRLAGEIVARSVVHKLRAATRYRVETGRASVLTRVARVLDHLAEGYGRQVSEGLLIDVPLPQHDIAALAGSSDKGVYRAYTHLRQKGVIEISYRRIVIVDLDLLRRYADEIG